MLSHLGKVIYLRVSDGLGNQMFQYAAGRGLALRNNAELVLEPSPDFFRWFGSDRRFGLEHFNLSAQTEIHYPKMVSWFTKRKNYGSEGISVHKEQNAYQFQEKIVELKAPVRLEGFFQSIQYFSHLPRRILIEEFTLKNKLSAEARKLQDRILKEGNSICLHIRLADYQSSDIFNCLSEDYYRSALQELKRNLTDTQSSIFVFSNGTREEVAELCKKSGIEDAEIHTERTIPEWELVHIMAKCRHHVTANSTFSWWAAWLKEQSGMTIMPKQWFREPSWEPTGLRMRNWSVI